MPKRTFFKFVAIIVFSVLLDITLHLVTSVFGTVPGNAQYGWLAGWLGPEAVAVLWALFAFSSVAYVFYRLRYYLPGNGMSKGLRYGAAIALLWLLAMLEGVSLFGNPLINEFVVGLSDAIPVFTMCLLLGRLTFKTEQRNTETESPAFSRKLLTICVFAGIFTLGRYAAYLTGVIRSGYTASPVFTFCWTLLMGACIGVVYLLLGGTGVTRSVNRRTLTFGLLIFGVNWTVFLLFMPFLFSGFLVDVLSRIILDVVLVALGCYLSLKLSLGPVQTVACRSSREPYQL